ncbi:MAG TPA: ABC transporter permease, partial [Candidatus Eisenbacteria bacterium]|nr:ABC transporter permease [Candidatus Eisenbacteria bacterium]
RARRRSRPPPIPPPGAEVAAVMHAPPPPASAAGAHAPPSPLMLNLRAVWARMYVRVVGSLREPAWIMSDAVFPSLSMAAFVLLYRALGAPRSFEALAVLGGIMATYWINVLWGMGAQLYWEKQSGQLQLYFVAPCSRMAILTGMAVGGVFMTTSRALFGIAVGFGLLGVRVQPFDALQLLLVFAVTMAALYALGMTLASLFLLYGREAWHVSNALQEPVFFLSGLYFPIRALGSLGAVAAGLVPLGLGVDAMRQVLMGREARGLLPIGVEVAILAVLAAGFLVLARAALAYLESLSKREGRLTQRWQ